MLIVSKTMEILMLAQAPNTKYLVSLYEEFKFWGPAVGAIYGFWKIVDWFKLLKTNDLRHIQAGVTDLKDELSKQTKTICDAMATNTDQIKELRSDIKTLTAAFIAPPRAKAAKAARRKK